MDRAVANVLAMCCQQIPTCSFLLNTCSYPQTQSLDNVKEWIQKYCNHPQYISYCENILKYYCCTNEKNSDQEIFDYFVTNIDFGLDFDNYILIKISVCSSNTYTLQYLIKHGIDVNIEDNILLKLAAEYGTFEVLKILIENGANIHAQNEYALRVAALKNCFDMVKLLVENGADIHVNNEYCLRVSIDAIDDGITNIFKYLIDHGANIEACQSEIAETAVRNRCTTTIKFLSSYVDFSKIELDIETLANVILNDDYELIKLLVDLGIDFSAINTYKSHDTTIKKINLLLNQNIDAVKLLMFLCEHSKDSQE